MRVLAFDTSLSACSAALLEDGAVRAARIEDRARGHGERLLGMIGEVLDDGGASYGDIDLICVTRGPGSFTGLRIGLAAARGLALALDRPILALTTHEALAAGARAASGQAILTLIDARRGQLYVQAFDGSGAPLSAPSALTPEAAAEAAPVLPLLLVGTGAALAEPHLRRLGHELVETSAPALPEAGCFGGLAFAPDRAVAKGQAPAPLYLRPPDARPAEPKAP